MTNWLMLLGVRSGSHDGKEDPGLKRVMKKSICHQKPDLSG